MTELVKVTGPTHARQSTLPRPIGHEVGPRAFRDRHAGVPSRSEPLDFAIDAAPRRARPREDLRARPRARRRLAGDRGTRAHRSRRPERLREVDSRPAARGFRATRRREDSGYKRTISAISETRGRWLKLLARARRDQCRI